MYGKQSTANGPSANSATSHCNPRMSSAYCKLGGARRAQKTASPGILSPCKSANRLQQIATLGAGMGHVAGAALCVVIVVPTQNERTLWHFFDSGQSAAYMQLVATELGIGSCLGTIYEPEQANALLGIPDDMQTRLVISFGYPADADAAAQPLRAGGRIDFDDIVHWGDLVSHRPRRLRLTPAIRNLTRETTLKPADFIYPLFVRHGDNQRLPIASMPGQAQLTVDLLAKEAREIQALGIQAALLFGIPAQKDACGSDNFADDGIIPRAIRAIKQAAPDLLVISDMCFCEYTNHGHCGIINTPDHEHYNSRLPAGYLLNDATLDLLGRASVTHARAGADIIAPSGMLDDMVSAIRAALDSDGFSHTAIMSYAAKAASVFYGPFRDAAESPPSFGDRAQYQLDPANGREALKEIALDVQQGADMLLIKPALPNLDIIHQARANWRLPLAAYQVSGEYAMLHGAAAHGWLDLRRAALESLISIRRAGADMIISYFAKDAIEWLDGA